MKYYLRSNNKELNNILNSESFIQNENVPFNSGNDISVGDTLYFNDIYYKQVAVIVESRVISGSSVWLTVNPISVEVIDPYLYGVDFEKEVLSALDSGFVRLNIDRYIKDCGDFKSDKDKVHQYAYYVGKYLIVKSPIDHFNILERIKSIIAEYWMVEYHRPQPWEFSEF